MHLVLRQLVHPGLRQHRLEDVLAHGLDQVLLLHARVVLGRQHHSVEAFDLAVLAVAQGDLALGIRTQPRQRRVLLLADLGLLLDQTVRVVERRRHEFRGFVAGVAEHQALVASALFFQLLGLLAAAINAGSDVYRLLAQHVDDGAGVAVEADVRVVVADRVDDVAGQVFDVDPRRGGDFAGDDGRTGLDQGFAGHAGAFVLGQDCVQHRVGDLVGNLVRMAFGDRFGGEQVAGHRGNIL
ncbi:hypothetical protein D3C71_1209300 [compost metagenome]